MLGSIERKEFESELAAWNWIHEEFKGKQWYRDHEAGKAAGYDIYRDLEEYYNYICCLGDRLEVNLKEGNQTINLWIIDSHDDGCVEGEPLLIRYDFSNLEVNEICDALYLCCNAFASNDIQRKTFKNVDDIIYKLNLIKKLIKPWNE